MAASLRVPQVTYAHPMEGAGFGAARRLAEATPDADVACPVCANTMKGASLATHLESKHGQTASLPTRWKGKDYASQTVALWLGLASIAIGVAGIVLIPEYDRLILGVIIVPLMGALGLAFACFAEKLPATLELKGDELELTTLFGLRVRRLRLPPKSIEIGQLRIWTESRVGGVNHVERMMGKYLRLTGDGATLIIGAPKGTNMGKRWDTEGFTHGPKRQYWHINLDRQALVQLEYHLAARGGLQPRSC